MEQGNDAPPSHVDCRIGSLEMKAADEGKKIRR